jgi:hypothetical protein
MRWVITEPFQFVIIRGIRGKEFLCLYFFDTKALKR